MKSLKVNRAAAIGLVVSVLLLWWTLHDVSFTHVLSRIRDVKLLPCLGAVVLTTLGLLPLRVIRWSYMLRAQGEIIPFAPLFHATAIGTMANYLLPARAGELVRAYGARELTPARFSTALGSIALERVVDGMTIVAMMVIALLVGDFDKEASLGAFSPARIALIATFVFGGALLAALFLVLFPGPVRRMSDFVLNAFLPDSMARNLGDLRDGIIAGFDSLGSASRILGVAVWSVVLWSANAAGIWLGLYAFGISVPWTAALMVQGFLGLAVTLPSSPGFFGPFEAAGRASLALYGVGASAALAFSAPFHLFAYFVPVILFGIVSLGRTGLKVSALSGGEAGLVSETDSGPSRGAAGGVSTVEEETSLKAGELAQRSG